MKITKAIGILILALVAAGCMAPAPLDFTVSGVGIVDQRVAAELADITVGFAQQQQQRRVETNEAIAPIWKSALTDALARSLVFTDGKEPRVNVSVRITEVDAPSAGLAMTTRVGAIYEVINRSNGDIIFAEEIRTEGTVPLDYALTGVTRARESVNRGVRANIAAFINALGSVDVDKPMFPAGKRQ